MSNMEGRRNQVAQEADEEKRRICRSRGEEGHTEMVMKGEKGR